MLREGRSSTLATSVASLPSSSLAQTLSQSRNMTQEMVRAICLFNPISMRGQIKEVVEYDCPISFSDRGILPVGVVCGYLARGAGHQPLLGLSPFLHPYHCRWSTVDHWLVVIKTVSGNELVTNPC